MDVMEAITGRKVKRAFTPQDVDLAQLNQIVNAGRHAMSARNQQPWQFIVIRDRASLRAIGALCTTGHFVAEAPAAIVILKDTANARWADVDCGQAVQNMANAAWGMGLGTCWVGNLEAGKIAQMLGVPDGWAIFTILPFGYPDPNVQAQKRALKPRSEVVHYERYGQNKS